MSAVWFAFGVIVGATTAVFLLALFMVSGEETYEREFEDARRGRE